MTHAKVFERFLDAGDTGTSLCNVGRTPEPDLSDVRSEGTEIRAEELGVAREGRRSPSVFRTYNAHVRSRHTGILPPARTTVRAPRALVSLARTAEALGRGNRSVDAPGLRAYHGGSRDPSSWSPLLRVGARTLRTEQCAKSQCVYPVDIGRCGSPCLPARRSYGKQHRKADPGVLLGEADFPTHEPETGLFGRVQRFSTESLILAQDERWRRA